VESSGRAQLGQQGDQVFEHQAAAGEGEPGDLPSLERPLETAALVRTALG